MDDSQQVGDSAEIPTFAELAADPEIAALLEFEPVPRKRVAEAPWTPELQREFIARLAAHGGVGRAADETGKTETSIRKLYRSPLAASFRASWHGAIDLAKRRREEEVPDGPAAMTRAPSIDHRRKDGPSPRPSPSRGEGEVLNEYGEHEDEASYRRRAAEAKDAFVRVGDEQRIVWECKISFERDW